MVFSRHDLWSELEQELQLQKYIEKLGVLISLWLPRGLRYRVCLHCRRPGSDPWVRKIP